MGFYKKNCFCTLELLLHRVEKEMEYFNDCVKLRMEYKKNMIV